MFVQSVVMRRNGLKRQWPLLLLIMFVLLALPASVLAEEGTLVKEEGTPVGEEGSLAGEEGSLAGEEGIPVALGKVIVLRIRHGAPEFSPYERAAEITRRLYGAFWTYRQDGALSPDQVRVVVENGQHVIYLGERLIVTVDEAHAQSNFSNQAALASKWAENLKTAIVAYMEILGSSP